MHLELEGEANDYVGKGLSGGDIVIKPFHDAAYAGLTHRNVILGNTALYGATGGTLFAAGRAGDRFAVRNSGAVAVIEGAGNHCCEYMTGGTVVVLGEVGRNFGAGMSNGVAYVLDETDSLAARLNGDMVAIRPLEPQDEVQLLTLVDRHLARTLSPRARRLVALGIGYIEGGWPGSNPKDAEFFRRIAGVPLQQAKIAAFGMTRHAGGDCAEDGNCRALVEAGTPVVTLVGKSSTLHVDRVLRTSRDENLRMIAESVAHFKALGKEVIYDAEHFFDGYRLDPAYALATLDAAADAGADCVVLCDTNGGALPTDVEARVWEVRDRITAPLGIHPHNDSGLALANALAAVEAGCVHVQGTINGYGERCGNLDLVQLIATLQLKLEYQVVAPERLRELRDAAHFVAAVASLYPHPHAPYVGRSAFAHKGGIHVAAVAQVPESYQHIDPALVGNEMRVVVSELAGRRTVRLRAAALGVPAGDREGAVLQRIKELEH